MPSGRLWQRASAAHSPGLARAACMFRWKQKASPARRRRPKPRPASEASRGRQCTARRRALGKGRPAPSRVWRCQPHRARRAASHMAMMIGSSHP
ncbi:hypothetical protein NL676_023796 [Syzygium grande]|nr:hypothetical protein NL676_023796 [Syzygium grande]